MRSVAVSGRRLPRGRSSPLSPTGNSTLRAQARENDQSSRGSETYGGSEEGDSLRSRERRIEERFRRSAGAERRDGDDRRNGLQYLQVRKVAENDGTSLMPDLLPESKEALKSYRRGPGNEGATLDEPVYASRRRRRGETSGRSTSNGMIGMVSVASVGGLVCALSLLSFSGKQSTYRTIDRQQISMSTLQNEVAKGTNKLFGHCRHEEADRSKLVSIQGAYRMELLRPAAARAFEDMRHAARRDGISLHLVSGFRSVKHQEDLYFGIKAERAQSSKERALVSAPPGFSEHHTGYALDICDETLSLDESFASTRAYRWLQQNARMFNFEMSFPENGQVAFEPWHWRFEGETEAIEAFYGR